MIIYTLQVTQNAEYKFIWTSLISVKRLQMLNVTNNLIWNSMQTYVFSRSAISPGMWKETSKILSYKPESTFPRIPSVLMTLT